MARELGDYAIARVSEELGVLRDDAAPEAALLAGLPLLVSPG